MINVLHITAHLGGGVGRVLSRIVGQRSKTNSGVMSVVVSLERTEKEQAAKLIRQAGVELVVAPGDEELRRLVSEADIVQMEWWHHPLLAGWMCRRGPLHARLVVWSHVSGLNYPVIPRDFMSLPHSFLFTSPVSRRMLDGLGGVGLNAIDVVQSSGGFDDIPVASGKSSGRFACGYLGALNFAKLHPDIVSYLKAVHVPGFKVDFHGDPESNPGITMLAEGAGIPERVNICGYTERPYDVLNGLDVFVYLLNPDHYGTTENALLEAMACSAVPVVLNNPVERSIVQDGRTGMIVDSPAAFARAISFLSDHPDERRRMGEAARRDVLSRFSLAATEQKLRDHYTRVMDSGKRDFDFIRCFGHSPAEWFASCLGGYAPLFEDADGTRWRKQRLQAPVLYERSKSSAFHFLRYFPDDEGLKRWTAMLEDDLAFACA